jgi:integrase
MRKIVLPKHPYKGLKIFCKKCRIDKSLCKHTDDLVYRARIHVPGTINGVKTKMLKADNYNDAVKEIIEFESELKNNNFQNIEQKTELGNDYSLLDALIKYNQYLNGDAEYSHLKKNITKGHKDELIRYCRFFLENLKLSKKIDRIRPIDVTQKDVSLFYNWADKKYEARTFNKCLVSVKGFFEFIIDIERILMRNPFKIFTKKQVIHSNIESITQEEFNEVLNSVDTFIPSVKLGGKGKVINLFKPWLKDGFKLFLLTGARREEVVDLKWSDIYVSRDGIKFFMFNNLKVNRIMKGNTPKLKYVPINADLEDLLIELGMNEKKDSKDYILCPDRNFSSYFIMNSLSKGFTHYKNGAGIKRNISLKTLRKTYITWHNQVMGKETGLITSHSNGDILEKFYIDAKVLSAIEKAALEVRIFGKTSHNSSHSFLTQT